MPETVHGCEFSLRMCCVCVVDVCECLDLEKTIKKKRCLKNDECEQKTRVLLCVRILLPADCKLLKYVRSVLNHQLYNQKKSMNKNKAMKSKLRKYE